MNQLIDYKVDFENPSPMTAQGTQILVQGIRANITKKDTSHITINEIEELIKKKLASIGSS